MRAAPGEGDIAIGGVTLAAETAAARVARTAALGLIDQYRARVHPVLARVPLERIGDD